MKYLFTTLLTVSLFTGPAFYSLALADEHGMERMHDMMHGKGYGKHHSYTGWKTSLSEEQRDKISKLKLEYKKTKLPIKARIKQAKIDLALLITTDKPNQKSIDKKIDEIVKLKAEKMRAKARYKTAVRKLLDEKQRVQFDLHLLKKASRGKHGGGHSGYHH